MEDSGSNGEGGKTVKPEIGDYHEISSGSVDQSIDTVDEKTEFRSQVASSETVSDRSEMESGQNTQQDEDLRRGAEDAKTAPELDSSEAAASETEPEKTNSKDEDEGLETKESEGQSRLKRDETCESLTGNNTSESGGAQVSDSGWQDDATNHLYYVKWITWKGLKTPIVTQNDNGPCPLIAVINILLLRRAIEFPAKQEMVTTSQLMAYLGDHVLKEVPQNLAEGAQRNFEQNMQDALSILPKLKTGLDVNVKFTGVSDFEFTPECVVFDLLNIHLYHGWLVDPQSIGYKAAIGALSYNQLVEKVVASKEQDAESQLASEGLMAESFLKDTANQLTYHGLCELNAKVKQDELCVFFRNNHFSTLYKHQNELFVLLTDQGFLTEDRIVWQTLSNVDGDGTFVDHAFKTLPMAEQPNTMPQRSVPSTGTLSQEDQDYMLALSIQSEQQPQQQTLPQQQTQLSSPQQPAPQPQETSTTNAPRHEGTSEQELFDLQYAMQLQEEEENRMRNQPQVRGQQRRTERRQSPPPQQPCQPRNNVQLRERSNCVIL